MTEGRGNNKNLIIIKIFSKIRWAESGKNTKAETPNNLFLRPASPVHPPPFYLIRQACSLFPTAIVTVDDNEDGGVGGLTVAPPFLIHSHYLLVKALQSASIMQSLHNSSDHTVNAPETRGVLGN